MEFSEGMNSPIEQAQACGARTVTHAMRKHKVANERDVEVLNQRQHVESDPYVACIPTSGHEHMQAFREDMNCTAI